MTGQTKPEQAMRLYNDRRQRLYVNAEERVRFLAVAKTLPPEHASLCLTLLYTGCRISEALELTPDRIDISHQIIVFRSLKKRGRLVMREVPVPQVLIEMLVQAHDIQDTSHASAQLLWQHRGKPLNRATAYRWIKAAMGKADIFGPQACPKGLRHGYGVHAMRSGVQLNMLQKWMGHASMSTTAIYADAVGPEEREIAERM